MNIMDLQIAKKRFIQQKSDAKRRKIEWMFTFEEWCEVWKLSGKWDQRGRGKGKYVMARHGDVGPYEKTNVSIKLCEENSQEAAANKIYTPAIRAKISANRKNIPRPLVKCPYCPKMADMTNAKRWHFERCKNLTR